jgi:hypothetical protein
MWVRECTVDYLYSQAHMLYTNLSTINKNIPVPEGLTVNYFNFSENDTT